MPLEDADQPGIDAQVERLLSDLDPPLTSEARHNTLLHPDPSNNRMRVSKVGTRPYFAPDGELRW